ncbi:MAG: hypothetical protein PHD25_01165 [Bacteroidales bacterium]|nr:hypothetical protein [Bacteroidales bacterium]
MNGSLKDSVRKNNKIIRAFLFILFWSPFWTTGQDQDTLRYIFMGHIYSSDHKIDPRVEQLDLSGYEGIWLGGDVQSEATLEYSTLQYIDSIFDLTSPTTYWALGNHDARNGNLEWLKEFTGRETYFTHYNKGITSIVMNTNLVPTDCENIEKQYKILMDVCDTIHFSSHLVLIMHHGIWRGVPNLPNPAAYSHSDFVYWNSNCDSSGSTFVKTIYPRLVEVKKRGTEVICIMGDTSGTPFSMDSVDEIHFMACGLNNSPLNAVLILEYHLSSRTMNWQFHNLDSLLIAQQERIIKK